MAGVVHIPWYATVFRGDALADAICELAAVSIRYGATQYRVQRSLDDRYRITQMTWFASRSDWLRYWEGPEMIAFRTNFMGKYQIPVLYVWHDEIAHDVIEPAAAEAPAVPAAPVTV